MSAEIDLSPDDLRMIAHERAGEVLRLSAINKEMVEVVKDAEYAISNSARIEGAKGPHSRDFDYEDFCCWAEHWVTSARAVLKKAQP